MKIRELEMKNKELCLKIKEYELQKIVGLQIKPHLSQQSYANQCPIYKPSVVFKDKLPSTYKGIKVINGDTHDRRFEDEQGVIVGLKFKGSAADKAIAIAGGFAI